MKRGSDSQPICPQRTRAHLSPPGVPFSVSQLRNLPPQLISTVARSQPVLSSTPRVSATSTSFFQASRAPVAFSREKEHSGRRTQEGRRGMCSDTLNPGGEVRGCCVGCILSIPEISPFVFIAARCQVLGISRTKEMLFQAGVFWVRRNLVVF